MKYGGGVFILLLFNFNYKYIHWRNFLRLHESVMVFRWVGSMCIILKKIFKGISRNVIYCVLNTNDNRVLLIETMSVNQICRAVGWIRLSYKMSSNFQRNIGTKNTLIETYSGYNSSVFLSLGNLFPNLVLNLLHQIVNHSFHVAASKNNLLLQKILFYYMYIRRCTMHQNVIFPWLLLLNWFWFVLKNIKHLITNVVYSMIYMVSCFANFDDKKAHRLAFQFISIAFSATMRNHNLCIYFCWTVAAYCITAWNDQIQN